MQSDDTLTGARLVEAVHGAIAGNLWAADSKRATARAALCAQAEAVGVTADDLSRIASDLRTTSLRLALKSKDGEKLAALLRALAEVLRDDP